MMMNEQISLTQAVACPNREEEPMDMNETTPATEMPDEAIAPTEEATAASTVEETDVTDRLAEEFLALAEEFPQFTDPNQLPDGVLELALEQNIALLDAYLRYRWQEEKRVATANAARRRAAVSSAGSLSRGAVETPPEQDAFLRAFRSAL